MTVVMPSLVPGINDLQLSTADGRDQPGHDEVRGAR